MKNTKFSKILLIALSVAILVGCAFIFSVSAEETATEDTILAQNIVYGDKVAIAYAVNASIEDAAAGNVTVNYYWEGAPDVVKKATYLSDTTCKIDGVEYPVFITEGVAPKELAKVAYATTDGETYKSYSAAEYLYIRLYEDGFVSKTEADGKDHNRKLLYQNLLAYGEQAQLVLDYNAEKLVTDYSIAFTTSDLINLAGKSYVFGYGEISVEGTVIGEGTIAGWTVTDVVNGGSEESDNVVLALDGAYQVEPLFGVHECEDIDPADHVCDSCGETISSCANDNNTEDHLCDVCGKVVDACADANTDGKCDVCGVYVFEGSAVISGSNVVIRNISSTNASFATNEAANTNSSSISAGAPTTMPYGAYMYLDTPASAVNKVLVINTLNAGGSTPSGCTKVTDYLSDVVFTPDVEVEDGDLIVLEFDYCMDSLTRAPSNSYPMLWYLDYSGDTADATINGIYSYNKGNPRLNADSKKAYGFAKQEWVRIRLVCDNTNKKLYSYVSADGGVNYNVCADVSALSATVDNIGLTFNVYDIDCLQYVDNLRCVKTNAATYGITLN